VLIVAGTLGLVYGSFSYAKATHGAKLGLLELQVKEKERVDIPLWPGAGAIAIGTFSLLTKSGNPKNTIIAGTCEKKLYNVATWLLIISRRRS